MQETDAVLEEILESQDSAQYLGACDRMARQFARVGYKGNGAAVERYIWGLVCRYNGNAYDGPGPMRQPRSGPVTWAELHIIEMANTSRSNETEPMDEAYLCNLLYRSKADIVAIWAKYGPAKGRRGFGFEG